MPSNNDNYSFLLWTRRPYHRRNFIDTRAQKMVSHTEVRIVESVFAHDHHWEEQNTLSSPNYIIIHKSSRSG